MEVHEVVIKNTENRVIIIINWLVGKTIYILSGN